MENRVVGRFIKYITCSSESCHESAMCRLIEGELDRLGIEHFRDNAGENFGSDGWNVYAFLPGESTASPLMFASHLDTVTPGTDIHPQIKDGVIRSDGTTVLGSDDKSGVAAIMEAMERLVESGVKHRPVEVLFSISEEIGLYGAKFADYSRFSAKECVTLDHGKTDSIINRSPAQLRMEIKIHGKASHAGVAPEHGIHSLKAACEAIANIPCGYVGDDSVMNVANLRSLGATNVVPDLTCFDMEIRSFNEETLQKLLADTKAAIATTCEKYGATWEMEVERHSSVLYVPENGKLIGQLCDALKKRGIEPKIESTFGGSDTTWFNANGISAANIGTGMMNVHSVDEYIAVKDLCDTADLVYEMMTNVD